jgi:hypothetical protein
VRFVVVGSAKDSGVGTALIDALRDSLFNVDDAFLAVNDLNEAVEVARSSKSPTRALLLISAEDDALFSSAVKLDEMLAQRGEFGTLVKGVLVEGQRGARSELASIATWRGAVPYSCIVTELERSRTAATKHDDVLSKSDEDPNLILEWTWIIRTGMLLVALVLAFILSSEARSMKSSAILVAVALVFACCVSDLRGTMKGRRRRLGRRALAFGISLVVAGIAFTYPWRWELGWNSILGLWLLVVAHLVFTFGGQEQASRD